MKKYIFALAMLSSFIFTGCTEEDKQASVVGETNTTETTQWYKIDSPTATDLHSVKFLSENEGWIVGEKGTILQSTDKGDAWIKFDKGITDEYLYDLDFADGTVYICGSETTLLKSKYDETGFHWLNITIPNGSDFYRKVQFMNSHRGWVLETNWHHAFTRLWYTLDNMTWAESVGIPYSENFSVKDFQFTKNQFPDVQNAGQFLYEGWLIGYEGDSPNGTAYLYRTTDGGRNWSIVMQDNDTYYSDIYFMDKNNGWITKSWGMLYTSNGGVTWNNYDFTAQTISPSTLQFVDTSTTSTKFNKKLLTQRFSSISPFKGLCHRFIKIIYKS